MSRAAPLMVAGAAVLWGLIAPVASLAYQCGWAPHTLAVYTHLALLPAAAALLYTGKVELREVLVYSLLLASMRLAYLTSVELNGPAVSAALLYTAPAMIAVARRRLGPEPLLATTGAWLALGAPLEATPGIAAGLASGAAYAALIVYSERVEKSLETAIAAQGLAALPLLPLCAAGCRPGNPAYPLILALLPGVAAYTMFMRGTRVVGAERASVIATLEPLTATSVSILLGEELGVLRAAGIALILAAAIRASMSMRV